MIREVIAYEATCDCGKDGCKERLFLGARKETLEIPLSMNGWRWEQGLVISARCEFPKKSKKKGKAK